MNKKFDYTPLIKYTDYAEKKYIKPEKAGDLKEDMELFRENGQEARKIFTQIAKSLEEKLDDFHVQKIILIEVELKIRMITIIFKILKKQEIDILKIFLKIMMNLTKILKHFRKITIRKILTVTRNIKICSMI